MHVIVRYIIIEVNAIISLIFTNIIFIHCCSRPLAKSKPLLFVIQWINHLLYSDGFQYAKSEEEVYKQSSPQYSK